nr:3458_t:CDS:2 [Entrophospora candida]
MNGINEQEFIRIPDVNFVEDNEIKKRSTPSIEKGKQPEIIIEIEDILIIKLVFTLETELSNNNYNGGLLNNEFDILELIDTCEFDILEIDSYCTNPNYPMDMESSFNSITNSKPIELAPDYVIERKRLDNLIESIKDGRLGEQKFHLSKSGHNLVDDLEDALKLEIENIND